jgi:hypothetical protein
MKKSIMAILVVVAANVCFADSIVQWSSTVGQSTLYDSHGNVLSPNGLVIQLVVDVNGDTDWGTLLSQGHYAVSDDSAPLQAQFGGTTASTDDDIIGTWNSGTWNNSGSIYPSIASETSQGSRHFYFRWFNANDPVSATEVGIIYSTAVGANAWITPVAVLGQPVTMDIPVAGADANVLGSANGTSGWATVAPVPEPTTMALMGLGLAAVAVRRRFSKKA